MKRAVIAVAVLVASCASAPKTPAEMLLGKWQCETDSSGVTIKGPFTYVAGGKSAFEASVAGEVGPGMKLDMSGAGEGTWTFLPDGKLEEMITKLTVAKGQVGGQDVPLAMLQGMTDQMIVNQKIASTVEIAPASMTMTSSDGATTNCTR